MSNKVLSVLKEIVIRIWRLIKFAGCLCLIAGTFYHGYNYFNKVFRNPEVNYGEAFHNMPEDSVDILVLGSSHAQYSFVPSFAYQDTGLYSYVLGTACQPIKVSYEMLKEALKTQNPELVILEVYTATPLKEMCDGDSCYITAEYQMTGQEKYNTINFLPEEKAKAYRNDFINYHNNWRTMESFEDFKYKDNSEIDISFGYIYNGSSLPVENSWYAARFDETVDVELNEDDLKAFNDIYNLCKEKGIQLLFYMMPMDCLDAVNQAYRYKIWDWANEHDVEYIDFIDLSDKIDYRMQVHSDGFHSYTNGAGIVTDYLCKFIQENYQFNSHTNNDELNSLYKRHINGNNIGVLIAEYNPMKYLPRLINTTGTIAIRYQPTYGVANKDICDLLKRIGVDDSFNPNRSYYAIIKDGELLESSETYIDFYDGDNHIEILNNMIAINHDIIDSSDCFSIVLFNTTYGNNVVKRIDLRNKPWEFGQNGVYERQ